ncbi:hypothetical protein E4O05_01520 [Treponema sp. OMZ 787]|uniref:hypothetical protein n=1 Tax=Treponema sp. OMZ 787 TaxID=2563669 RepID=UPI0020A5153E|nr:hypothetical protein [Treponema sp. OMZ 787]UTC62617.1 hypothetical protein E4O05_01520 [Treponema sp. OMZ 787]
MKRNINVLMGAFLAISMLVLFSSCTQPGWIVLDKEQQFMYSNFIVELTVKVQRNELSAADIEEELEENNVYLKVFKFRIVDTKAGTNVPKGSTLAYVQKRFLPAKLK